MKTFLVICATIVVLIAFRAHSVWHNQWPVQFENKPVVVTGKIISIPQTLEHAVRFEFLVSNLNHHAFKKKILLSWYFTERHLHAGETWRFLIKVKRVHGLRNPGLPNYANYLLARNIMAKGYVKESRVNRKLQDAGLSFVVLREYLYHRIQRVLQGKTFLGIVSALAIGERQEITQDQWTVFRRTGTAHLVAISGLHVGLVAGVGYGIFNLTWRLSESALLFYPAQYVGALGGIFFAILYTALSGFSISATRACIMIVLLGIAKIKSRLVKLWDVWVVAWLLCALLNPFSLYLMSFWLSFGAVFVLVYTMQGRINPSGLIWKYGRAQCMVFIGLAPLTLLFFNGVSVVSILANAVAIPYVSFLVVPCVLGGLVFSNKLWLLANVLLQYLWSGLSFLSNLSFSYFHYVFSNTWLGVIGCVAVLVLLLPAGMPGRWLGLCWAFPLVFLGPTRPPENEFSLIVLDIGQGLATVVETAHHRLVFDTGARFPDGSDMGSRVILPYLDYRHVPRLDAMVLSHGDSDHSGGSHSILKAMPVARIYASTDVMKRHRLPRKHPPVFDCHAGMSWRWDGVLFQFLYPPKDADVSGNDSSCVLRVSSGKHAVLIPGDIEAPAEAVLLQSNDLADLKSDVLVAAHHGSHTSSTAEFIKAVDPSKVIFSTGYLNGYHFPHPSIVKRYRQFGVAMFNTAEVGAVEWDSWQPEKLIYGLKSL